MVYTGVEIPLNNNIALGELFRSIIIVDPVVVIPDMLSKKASVTDSFSSEKINGMEPKTAILNQDKAVNKNACCKLSFFS